MLKRLSFRSKLLLVLFVPFIALVVVAAAGLSDRFSTLRAQEQYGALAGPLTRLDEASRAIENESVVSSWSVAGTAPSADLNAARERTDAALTAYRADHDQFVNSGIGTAALAALDRADRTLVGLPAERRKVDAKSADAGQVRGWYLGADDDLLSFGQQVARSLAAPVTSAAVTRSYSLQRAQHELARQASIQIAVVATGQPQAFSEWVSAFSARQQAVADFVAAATSEELGAFAATGVSTEAAALPTAFPAQPAAPAAVLDEYQTQARKLDDAITSVDATIRVASSAAASAAAGDVRLYGGVAALAMLLTLGLMWFVSKAVVGPVRRLTAAAREMSQRQLPALVESLRTGGDVSAITPTHIDVQSEDEIGELAQAFNDVETVTLEVAQQQSVLLQKGMGDLFVNLARRNQSLLERQLELLDELERNEHDPGALDALFKLDHMATRMRRNAESLLVLSGAEQPRLWQDAIGLLDVVRSAAAEIADFPRVELVGIDERIAVAGRAVSDVSHLLAELLENATAFSSPETAVVVSGAITKSGFVVAITDQGIGIGTDRIAEANTLLRNPPVVGLALSRALGLHVVGALAKRHGIAVELRRGTPGGTVALVALPKAILEARGPDAPPAPMPPIYAPDVDEYGDAEPLGARRAAPAVPAPGAPAPAAAAPPATAPEWHPMDEPPVEQWRRETIAAEQAAAAAAAAPVTAEPTVAEPTVAEPNPAEAPNVEPAPVESAPAEPVVGETVVGEQVVAEGLAEPTFAEPTFSEGFAEPAPPADGPGPAAEEVPEEVPLATRVPGANLSHTPTSAEGEPADDGDPMRPYRVHELLTRHSQGVNRGHTNEPVGDVDPVDTATFDTATFDTATFDTATFDVGQFDDPATPGGPVAAEPEDLR